MNNERIIVYLHALNWTMGEFAFFDIVLSGDGALLLSRCDKLSELDCSYSDLRDITLNNDSQLSKIILSPNHKIKPKSWEYVQKIVERNHGVIGYQDLD